MLKIYIYATSIRYLASVYSSKLYTIRIKTQGEIIVNTIYPDKKVLVFNFK